MRSILELVVEFYFLENSIGIALHEEAIQEDLTTLMFYKDLDIFYYGLAHFSVCLLLGVLQEFVIGNNLFPLPFLDICCFFISKSLISVY